MGEDLVMMGDRCTGTILIEGGVAIKVDVGGDVAAGTLWRRL